MSTLFTSTQNRGLQIAYNSGSVEAHIYPERPETPPQPTSFVPLPRDADFVERGTLLEQIRQRCSAPASRVALVGLGGVGKTQLAVEHCYCTAEQSPDTWIFWANANNVEELEHSLYEIADEVKIRGRKDSQANVLKLVCDWLRDIRNGRWLLVLDNADDVAVLSPANGGNTLQYLLPSSHGSVLVLSRTKRAAMQVVEDSEIISLEPMDDESASALLRKKLRNVSEENDDNSIAQLATELDRIPLALIQAAAYIRERAPRCSVQRYLDEYRQSDSRKISLLKREAGHLRRDQGASNSVLITWQISFDHIRKTRNSAVDLLSLMSFFDRNRIQETLLRPRNSTADKCVPAVGTDDDFEDDVLMLRDYSLINVTRDANTFEMHSLVQLATRAWLENEAQLDKWRNQFISNLCAELPPLQAENYGKYEMLFAHLQAALIQQPKSLESLLRWALLLYNAADYAKQTGRSIEAEQMSVASMEVRKDLLGEEHKDTLMSMRSLAMAETMRGKYKEAEAKLRQVLKLLERKAHGHVSHDRQAGIKNLVSMLSYQGKYQEAEVMQRKVLALCKELRGYEHLRTLLTTVNQLAVTLHLQHKNQEAEVLRSQMLAICEELLGHEDSLTSLSKFHLAITLDDLGKFKEAETMYRQALAVHEKVFGHMNAKTLYNVYILAMSLENRHCYDEALPLFKRAYTGFLDVLGENHSLSRRCLENYTTALESHRAN